MKHLKLLFVVCAWILTPSVVQADDGGWLDWLYSMDKSFLGGAAEIHALCLGENHERLPGCENWFRNVKYLITDPTQISHKVKFTEVRHEIDLRGALYHSVAKTTSTGVDPGSMWAAKLGGMYYYHVPKHPLLGLELGAGESVIRFGGDDDNVHPVWARIESGDVRFVPGRWAGNTFHIEVNCYSHGLTGTAKAPNGEVTFASKREFRVSLGFGLNLWRVHP
jgi:hypothetical protein